MQIVSAFYLLVSLLFISITLAQSSIEKLTTSINGTIIQSDLNPLAMVSSENGKFWCTYDILAVTDEIRELGNLKVYEDKSLILSRTEIPGSDIELTNSGKIIFYDHSEHFKAKLKIYVYSLNGSFLFSKDFERADRFEFSTNGEKMEVEAKDGISIISLNSGNSYLVEKGLQYAIGDQNDFVAVALSGRILIYKNSTLQRTIQNGIELPRKILISTGLNIVGVIDKYHLKVYSLNNYQLLFEDKIGGELSFRDLKIVDGRIVAGVHKRNKNESTGYLRIYELNGKLIDEKKGESRELRIFENIKLEKKSQSNYDPIPWPFFPFDSMRTVWNHYEQHMGLGGTSSYLHQGLDLITPIGENTFSVVDGYVKLVLTLGGSSYWRMAISPEQVPGWSDGWLSAHLIQSTIQFDVGDTVNMHDYLGDIVQWSGNWGHIHFVEIHDSGTVWLYNDNEWGINFNPALALQPYPDTTPPYIDPVFSWSKFAFAVNESATYLQPDSLFGEIDIIVKVVDYAGDSEWQQPAYTTWYTIKRVSDGQIIKPRTLGTILNHKYPFYETVWFEDYAGVIYQRDNTLLPSGWMDMQRNFYHNLTNNNGDSLVELSEKSLAFHTDNYTDGDYRIIIEVYDEAGNSDIDSMDVKFKNGNPVGTENEAGKIYSFNLEQNYPNPFNPSTIIKFILPEKANVELSVYNSLGEKVADVFNGELKEGYQEIEFSAESLASGIYFYRIKTGNFVESKKMILIK